MSAYLKNIAPKDGQVEEWRCTYSQRGTVAAGTFGRVTCRSDQPGEIIGLLLGA
ncbi:MAG: hypothetical protein ACR2NV_08740 [Thermoleophilaceae bacterium]